MNYFPLKMNTVLVFALFGFSFLFGQNSTLTGYWLPSSENYPKLEISSGAEGMRIHAEGGFLNSTLEAVRLQQVAGSGSPQVQVVFPSSGANIVLKLQFLGKNLRASWSRPGQIEELFRTVYHKSFKAKSLAPNGRGAIKGHPIGKAKSTASIFQVSLYGPDNDRQFICTQSLGKNGGFNFDGLADGEYWLYTEPRGATIIEAFPAVKKVIIKGGNASVVNIELK